jgi:hypothetical protein
MKQYSGKISLVKNSRGIYCLDTTMGCGSGMAETINGCYGDCYAAKSAKTYGFDFSKTVLRSFENEAHRKETIKQINNSKLDFIRIGCSGDPSENWKHTISILNKIKNCNKEIVIITKHWIPLSDDHIIRLKKAGAVVNTSVTSTLDTDRAWTATCTAANNILGNFTYVIYPASYGNLSNIVQNGALSVLTAFTNLGDFTVTNAFGASILVRIYKSNSDKAFASGTTLAIS